MKRARRDRTPRKFFIHDDGCIQEWAETKKEAFQTQKRFYKHGWVGKRLEEDEEK